MSRISRTEMDLRFRPAAERTLMRLSHALRRLGVSSMKIGCVLGATGLALLFFPQIGAPLLAVGFLMAVLGGATRIVGSLPRAPLAWLRRRRLHRAPAGGAITLRGHARTIRTVQSPLGEEVIAFRARFTRGGRGPEIEKAEPFFLDDDQPEPALVAVEHLYLERPFQELDFVSGSLPVDGLDLLPSGNVSTRYQEASLIAGEAIEVTGWIEEEIDPTINTLFRGPSVRRILRGRPDVPLIVRVVEKR